MKLLALEHYFYEDKVAKVMINLEDISYLDFEGYEYWPPSHQVTDWNNYKATHADPNSIGVCMKSGRRFPLTAVSGQLLMSQLQLQGMVVSSV